jgi:peptidoglycan L-alanyl-D-glutamate endopeptidase CwlK
MNTELFKKIDTSKLYPPLLIKLEQLIENCSKRGVDYYAVSGFRDWEEQDKLYAQGRNKKGKVIDKSQVVTNAKGGESNHNYSVAADWCADSDKTRYGLQPNWNTESYRILAEEAQHLGLEAGFFWKFKDAPHIQLNLAKNGLSFQDLRNAYTTDSGGMSAVWALLDKYSWG